MRGIGFPLLDIYHCAVNNVVYSVFLYTSYTRVSQRKMGIPFLLVCAERNTIQIIYFATGEYLFTRFMDRVFSFVWPRFWYASIGCNALRTRWALYILLSGYGCEFHTVFMAFLRSEGEIGIQSTAELLADIVWNDRHFWISTIHWFFPICIYPMKNV